MLVPVVAAVLFFFVFYNFLNTRKRDFGVKADKGRNALISLLLSLVVLVLLWYLLIYLATSGIIGGAFSWMPRF